MAKLFHFPLDPASRAIRMVLSEYALEAELIEERPWEARPGFLALNPTGLLPVFINDDQVTIASVEALREYFEENHKGNVRALMGETYTSRAETRRLVAWMDGKFHHEVSGPILTELMVKRFLGKSHGGGAPNMGRIRAALGNAQTHFAYLSDLIDRRYWLSSENLSHADLTTAAHISCLDYLGKADWTDFPILKEWYQRIKSRPSFRPLLADHVRGITASADYANLDF